VERGAARSVAAIPATLADSLMARLDRLSTAKAVAQRAAVLGREFGYPLLAATAGLDEAALRHGLARLGAAEILFARGEPPAAIYTFKHALIQETAYQSLLKRTRQQLHAHVAQVLEERFPERVAAEPEVLARHAEAAGLAATAVTYYQRAGERAWERSARDEAITQFRKAIALVGTLPAGPQRDAREARVQLALGGTLSAARGYAHAETEAAYERARALCEAAGDSVTLASVLSALSNLYLDRGEPDRGVILTERLLAMSDETRDRSLVLFGHNNAAFAKHYQGRFAASLAHCERVLAFYDPARDRGRAFHHGFPNDPCVAMLGCAALNLWYLGHPDRSLGRAREGVTLARTLGEPFNLAFALFMETQVHELRRDWRAQRERATEVIAVADVQSFPLWRGAGRIYHGLARVHAGEGADALTEVAEGLALTAVAAHGGGAPAVLSALADGQRAAGQHAAALGMVESGLAVATDTGQHFYDAGLFHLKGELLLGTDPASSAEAEALFCRALDIARAQEAKSLELRAATSLARLWHREGKRAEAHALLAPVYACFTEGFDTGDLVEANALLEELR
jgi:predicted ATPase